MSDSSTSESNASRSANWSVIGTVAHLGATPEQAAAATYALPPARLPYLDGLYSFEYGHGRRVYLGKRVLLFRDADDPDPQATLGRLADRVRMESGELPRAVEVYLINDLRDLGTIRVDRADDTTREELFSPVYGYVHTEVTDAASLTAWLTKVDDLTFARVGDDGHPLLGGRRFPNTRTAGITTEDVAALYQAHDELDQPRETARQRLAKLPATAKAAAEHAIELAKAGDHNAWKMARRDAAFAVEEADQDIALQAIDELSRAVPSPGFSLDPEWIPDPEDPRHPLILAKIRAFAEDPCRELRAIARRAETLENQQPKADRQTARTARAIDLRHAVNAWLEPHPELCLRIRQRVSPRLRDIATRVAWAPAETWDTSLISYHQLIKDIHREAVEDSEDYAAWLTYGALDYDKDDARVQCGRYMGVARTRVGMTLFYTDLLDLLAKLWESTDYASSAPVVEVPGFLSTPRLDLPIDFHDAMEDLLGTRLWFGVRASGVSRMGASDRTTLVFDHRFTRQPAGPRSTRAYPGASGSACRPRCSTPGHAG